MKVVVNRCWGGFGLSDEAQKFCNDRGLVYDHCYRSPKEFRTNPILVECVETLREKADGPHADLNVVEIPFDSTEGWYIHDYDGQETIREEHRSW